MKNSRVLIAAILLGTALFGAWLFARSRNEMTSSVPALAPSGDKEHVAKICVLQYVSHPLLDAVYKGFREELDREHYPLSSVEYENANGDATTAALLADQACKHRYGVVFALATPMAQSVKSACSSIQPILFGAITDPVTAGLVDSLTAPGANVTGTSDQWPYDLQMQLTAHLWGNNASVGVPFNPAEANTQFAMDQVRRIAKRIGLTLIEVPINSVNEAAQAIDALAGKVQVIYVPADNTAVAAAPSIISTADRLKIPVLAGDPGTYRAGAAVGLGVDYASLGVLNARQARKILDGTPPSDLPVEVSSRAELYIDEQRAAKYNISAASVREWYSTVDH